MNMPLENTSGIDHEWTVTWHDYFEKLPIRKYEKKDVHIWSAYQGMTILNRMISDTHEGVYNITLESLVESSQKFNDLVDYLTRGRVVFNQDHLDRVYSWVYTPWRENSGPLTDPQGLYNKWPEWKREAFHVIVKEETVEMFKNYGYVL